MCSEPENEKDNREACSFEPDKRYGDAAQLRRAVEKCQANNRKKVYKKQAQSLD